MKTKIVLTSAKARALFVLGTLLVFGVCADSALAAIVSIGEAVDNTAITWITGGDVSWYGQTATSYYGGDSAQSGDIADGQTSWFRYQTGWVSGFYLRFVWKVSSEAGYDKLSFYIDSELIDSISGEVGWQTTAYYIPGDNNWLYWKYEKDGSVSAGADAGWVDHVEVFTGWAAPLIPEAVDNTALTWQTSWSGYGEPWKGEPFISVYGGDAAQSGDVYGVGSYSYLDTGVTGPGTLRFWWKVSCAPNDHLRFYIDGVARDSIYGNVDWQQETFTIDSGYHTLRWSFTKTGTYGMGMDAGWLDKVEFISDTLENVKTWYWTDDTGISSVAVGNVDADGQVEIVTGGRYWDGSRWVAQLCVWDGSTLALEGVKTWYWVSLTYIESVAIGDVDGDAQTEIVTGGHYYDGTRYRAQLCVWNGATLALENVKTWYWTGSTGIYSVAVGNVDADGQVEIVTGGDYYDGTRHVAQLCVWNGATLALENVKTWYWTGDTGIYSVAVGNVDADGQVEIVTGGGYYDGSRWVAQLCVWNGATLALENVKTWYWTGDTVINSVVTGDVDGDGNTEIITGGNYYDGTRNVAQLCVWNGATLALENVKTWYWTGSTFINSVAVGNVDADGQVEIVTGGNYYDGTLSVAQLCVWNGATLALENVKTWYWTSHTYIYSVAVGNVDADGQVEIVTGGQDYDGTRYVAQLCVWGLT